MAAPPLSLDTPPDIEQMQIEGWRRMPPEQKAALVGAMTRAVLDLART